MRGTERPVVEVCVLGRFRVQVDGRPVTLTSDRLRVLLAVLAMSAGRAVSVERLIDAAWGDDLPNDARRTLQTYIHRLRSALGSGAIKTDPGGYVLDTDPDRVDALRFVGLIDGAAGGPGADRASLVEALLLWRGDPFEGLASTWLAENEATHLRDRRLTALEQRIDLDLADGRYGEVVAELGAMLAEHPLHEPLWARLLRALAGSGRQAEALERYALVRERIADELGVDPGAELQAVHAALLAEQPIGRPTEPLGPPPERVVPRQVPVDVPGFTGRAQSLAALDAVLEGHTSERVAIVAVHGAGGVGKTSLVAHWAHRSADHFPDGQLYLNLRGYGPETPVSPSSALDGLLRGLAIAGEQIPPDEEARGSLLRSILAQRRVLVILDNARDGEQVRPLLPGSGSSVVIVTSRSQLRSLVAREGAVRCTLDQLDPDESVTLLAGSLDRAGVSYDPRLLRTLADQCGHLPLALAIAAEHATRQPDAGLHALVEELDEERTRLDVLNSGNESADLRTVFAWSYRALDDDTARMFRLLGLHPGADIGVGAAAALAGVPQAAAGRHLDRLVDTNLLLQRHTGRYELHDLLRTYAAELCDEHDLEPARIDALGRYLDWYAHSAGNCQAVLRAVPPVVELGDAPPVIAPVTVDGVDHAMAWFDSEREALTACVRFAAGRGDDATAYRLLDLAQVYLRRRRAFDDLLSLTPLALAAAQRAGDIGAEAQMTNLLGIVNAELRDLTTSTGYLEHALELFEKAGHLEGQQRTLVNLGITHDQLGDTKDAADCLALAVTINRCREQTDEAVLSLVRSLYNQAEACVLLGRIDEAVALSAEAITLCRGLPMDPSFEGNATDTYANALAAEGRHRDAIPHFERAIELFRSAQDRWFECITLTRLTRSYRAAGEAELGRAVALRALALFDESGAVDGMDLTRADIVELLGDDARQPLNVRG